MVVPWTTRRRWGGRRSPCVGWGGRDGEAAAANSRAENRKVVQFEGSGRRVRSAAQQKQAKRTSWQCLVGRQPLGRGFRRWRDDHIERRQSPHIDGHTTGQEKRQAAGHVRVCIVWRLVEWHTVFPERLFQVIRPKQLATATHTPTRQAQWHHNNETQSHYITATMSDRAEGTHCAITLPLRQGSHGTTWQGGPHNRRPQPFPALDVRQCHTCVHAHARRGSSPPGGLSAPASSPLGGHAQPRLRERVVSHVRNKLLGGQPNEPDDPRVRGDKAGASEIV